MAPEADDAAFLTQLFDGTSGAFGPDDNRTVIQFLWRLLNAGPNCTANYVKGVATGGCRMWRGVKGFFGTGFDSKIVEGLRDIYAKWHPKMKIVLVGYSRGGVEACVVSNILSIIGVPEVQHLPGSHKDFAQVVYETFMAGKLDAQKESLEDLYRCQPVTVEALLAFDNVGTIGIPRTGILKPLKFFKAQKDPGFDGQLRGQTNTMSDLVRNAAHAVAFHELRKPYSPILLYKSPRSTCNLKNVIFPGTHSHAGKQSVTSDPIEDLYLAWAISYLRDLGVPMRETMLRDRFPAYRRSVATWSEIEDEMGQGRDDSYAQGDISPRHSMVMKIGAVLLGRSTRTPKKWLKPYLEANVQFHAAFQAREGRARAADPALGGLYYKQGLAGGSYTDRATFPAIMGGQSQSRSPSDSNTSITTFREAGLTPFEEKLHGTRGLSHYASSCG
ncbi:hypothetical protein LTR84_001343 [Exophiala bonariae]|uniref:T6SS Phospholipase effector Tle1-like catalytic domain-containing protein n=1 Tax=Exophiala bonariae TaxID=1690606 RepID=A0AAV9NFW5_9EURO|nr:hypothetical protein LTR84_001343 [Exophiala bonariae]